MTEGLQHTTLNREPPPPCRPPSVAHTLIRCCTILYLLLITVLKTIPRDTSVAKAVFEVEGELLKGAFKLYPKMKAFYEVRKDKEDMFEYGHCLKAFPDEEIKIIQRAELQEKKNFFSNW